ncbi:MAG: hypothetical protein ACKOWF_00845 [Chloroflexota bacterium]
MEASSFDRIARLLAAPASRRSGLLAALAPFLAGALSGNATATATAGRARRDRRDAPEGRRSPRPEGPCGDGSRKDNACTTDKQCCTGFCNLALAKKNDDGKGRCRCIKSGNSCNSKSVCCKGACVKGRCAAPANVAKTCFAKVGCTNERASCVAYEGTSTTGAYCLLPAGEGCSTPEQCVSNRCIGGVCAACSCAACARPCTPDVCPTCAHATIQAAIAAAPAGSVVNIAPGSYVEDIEISRPLTLRACRAAGDATPVVVRNATYCRTIDVTGGAALDLIDITVEGYNDINTTNWGGGIATDGDLRLCGRTIVRNGAWDSGGGINLNAQDRTLLIADNAEVSGNYSVSDGGGIFVVGENDVVVEGSALIAGNISTGGFGGGMYAVDGASVSVAGNARFHANTAAEGGGLAHIRGASSRTYQIHVTGDARFTDNRATTGDGGAIAAKIYNSSTYYPALLTIDGNAELSGNSAGYDGGAISNCAVPTVIAGDAVISGNVAGSTNVALGPCLEKVEQQGQPGGASPENPPVNGGRGGAVWMSGGLGGWPAGVTGFNLAGNAAIRSNGANQAGGVYLDDTAAALSGAATVSANTAAAEGGGFLLDVQVLAPSSLTVSGQATITGNTALDGGGVYSNDAANTLTAAAGSISGNTTNNCAGSGISC